MPFMELVSLPATAAVIAFPMPDVRGRCVHHSVDHNTLSLAFLAFYVVFFPYRRGGTPFVLGATCVAEAPQAETDLGERAVSV